jgi:phage terminase large subunit GpA-like protein
LQWEKDALPERAKETTFLCCPVNGCAIEETAKEEMNAKGVLIAPGQTIVNDEAVGEHVTNSTFSMWVSGLASPFMSWGERVKEIEEARITGIPGAEKAALNKLGELYSPQAVNAVSADEVRRNLVKGWFKGQSPLDVIRLTMGVDIQGNRLVYAVRGWGSGARSWLIDSGEIWGRTNEDKVWAELGDYIMREYGGMVIEKCLVDSGFRPDKPEAGDYHKVYAFSRQFTGLVIPCKGVARQNVPVIWRDVDAGAVGKTRVFNLKLLSVDTDYFKTLVVSRLLTTHPQKGSFYLPENIDDDYMKQLASEWRDEEGVWHKNYQHNHYFDAEVLAAAGGYLIEVHNFPEGLMRAEPPKALEANNEEEVSIKRPDIKNKWAEFSKNRFKK